ncbi:MAG: rRNA pseudouridine synthase [Planctomycetes bacterium]|nr:rRNA pseudouridine synthase [Planctomycetota bacterium]
MSRRHEDDRRRSRNDRTPKSPARGVRKPGTRGTGTRSTGPRAGARRRQGLIVTPAAAPNAIADGKVRLNQFLAQCGVCSRRAADELIAAGRVELNGTVVTELGTRVDPEHDEVLFDGNSVRPEKSVYVLFNKPKGVVCTTARHEQKKRVVDFMPTVRGRLFTVGRLDLDSEGLILLTNDGPFALEMTHPRYGIPKLYNVVLRGRVTQDEISRARGGVWLAEGPTAGMRVRVARTTRDRTFLKVTLREGKNREIRRVFAKLGYPVAALKRVRLGELSLHGLGVGKWRFLHLHEVQELRQLARRDELPVDESAQARTTKTRPTQTRSAHKKPARTKPGQTNRPRRVGQEKRK